MIPMNDQLQAILQSKMAFRRKLARLSIAEKLRIVEQLAERTRSIRQGRLSRHRQP